MNNKVKTVVAQAVAACMLIIPLAGCGPSDPGTVYEGNIVKFDYNDNKSRPYSVLVDDDLSVDEPSAPELEGRVFDGWYTEKEGGVKVSFPYTVDEDSEETVLYAHWTLRRYTVTYHYNYEGADNDIYTTQEETYGNTVNAPAEPTRNDQSETPVFFGWELVSEDFDETTAVSFPYTVNGDADLYAHWVRGIVNITFNYNYENSPESVSLRREEGVAFNRPTQFQNANMSRVYYEFVGWGTTPDATRTLSNAQISRLTINPESRDVSLYAIWRRANYQYAFRYNDPNRAGEIYATGSVLGGDGIEEPASAPTRDGYTFAGWALDQRKNDTTVEFPYVPTATTLFYAKWESNAVETDRFDAEFTYIDPTVQHLGYSGSAFGAGCIGFEDVRGASSPDYPLISTSTNEQGVSHRNMYVSFMYRRGDTITFEIYSSAATTVTLHASIGMEASDSIVLAPTGENAWQVLVNGESHDYGSINMAGRPKVGTQAMYACAVSRENLGTISLKEGKNVIQLVTANNNGAAMGGAMEAVAPYVDYISFSNPSTPATFSWHPLYDNVYAWIA